MNYLSQQDLLDLHTYAVERYGGMLGIKSQDRLQEALAAPARVLFGAELYPELYSKAATLVFLLLKSRPFLSANEPTALLALLRMLAINGSALHPSMSEHEIATTFRAINFSELDKDGFEEWLRRSIAGPPADPAHAEPDRS